MAHCHHVGIFTNRPQALISFYTEKMGFQKGETKTLTEDLMERIFRVSMACTLFKLTLDRVILEIISPQTHEPEKRAKRMMGYNHWGLSMCNKRAYCAELEEKGVPFIKVGEEDRFLFFVRDPDGNLVEICEE